MIAPGWHVSALLWLLPWMVAPAIALLWRTQPTVGHGLRRWGLWLLLLCTAIQLFGHFLHEPLQWFVLWVAPPPDPYPPGPMGYFVPDLASVGLILLTGGIGVIGRFVGMWVVVLGFARLVRTKMAEWVDEGPDA